MVHRRQSLLLGGSVVTLAFWIALAGAQQVSQLSAFGAPSKPASQTPTANGQQSSASYPRPEPGSKAVEPSVIDLERDLGLVPYQYGKVFAAAVTTKLADANTTKLQEAFDKAAGTATTFVVTKCFPIGTEPLRVPGGVALVSGGLANHRPQAFRQKMGADHGITGGCLMRTAASPKPILRLNGYGNTIENVVLCGAFWELETPATFYDGGAKTDKPYHAGCGIEIVRDKNPGPNSGHHTISVGIEWCDVGIRFTHTGQEDHSDVCNFPRLDFHEVTTAIEVNNKQSVGHHFQHLYFQASLQDEKPCTVFDLQRGGRIGVGTCVVNGPCTVVNTNDVDMNTGALTIEHLYCDAACFRSVRPMRLLHMQLRRDMFLRITGAFSWGKAGNLSTRWYNADSSELFSGELGAANIRVDIFGLSEPDQATYGMFR